MNKKLKFAKNIFMKKFFKKVLIGFFSGIISGLFSSGGGLILVPLFINFLGLSEKESRATTIFCILPMVIVTAFFYNSENYLDLNLGIYCAIGGILGGIIGSIILNKLKTKYLKLIFSIFLLYSGIRLML